MGLKQAMMCTHSARQKTIEIAMVRVHTAGQMPLVAPSKW